MSAAELQELGLTPEMLTERRQKVQEMLKRNEPTQQEQETTEAAFVEGSLRNRPGMMMLEGLPKASRKPRSDKGQKRKPESVPEPQRTGVLTQEQASKLRALTNAELKAHLALAEAERNMKKASTDVLDFVDSLTKP